MTALACIYSWCLLSLLMQNKLEMARHISMRSLATDVTLMYHKKFFFYIYPPMHNYVGNVGRNLHFTFFGGKSAHGRLISSVTVRLVLKLLARTGVSYGTEEGPVGWEPVRECLEKRKSFKLFVGGHYLESWRLRSLPRSLTRTVRGKNMNTSDLSSSRRAISVSTVLYKVSLNSGYKCQS